MSFNIDNHPPIHTSVHNFKNPDSLNIYKQPKPKRLIVKMLLGNNYAVYTCEELKAIISLKETPIMGWVSRKEYKMHIAQKQRAIQYLNQKRLEKENKEKSL